MTSWVIRTEIFKLCYWPIFIIIFKQIYFIKPKYSYALSYFVNFKVIENRKK